MTGWELVLAGAARKRRPLSLRRKIMIHFTPAQAIYREQVTEKKRRGLLRRFLYFTGGVSIDLVDRYPWEKPKYLALAISVLVASAVSMMTMIIFLFGVFQKNMPVLENGVEMLRPQPFSPLGVIGIVLCAALWGCIMYALNWYFLIAMKKGEGFLKNVPAILIKVVFALTMGFMDTLPLQVGIFKDYLPAVKGELRVAYMEKMEISENEKIEAAETKNQAAGENLQRWQSGEPEAINSDPTVIDLRSKGAAIQKEDDDLRPAYRAANNRDWNAINTAQNKIQNLQAQITTLDQNIGEQGEELVRLQDEIKTLEREIRNRNAEINGRNRVLADLAGQKKEVENRISARYQEINDDRAVIGQRLMDEAKRAGNELGEVILSAKTAQSRSVLDGRVFESDNLVSNVIALGILEQGKGSFVETEIGKRVRLFSLLLAVVVMFIDLGPVIILLFLDKGACEFDPEQATLNEHFRITTEAEAFQQNYSEMAQIMERNKMELEMLRDKMEMQKQYGSLKIEMWQKVTDWYMEFNSILDSMWKRIDQDTSALVARTAEMTGENESLRETAIAFRKEMLRQFEETTDKMLFEFRNFIRSFDLSSPPTNQ
jgi:hypothetical protein